MRTLKSMEEANECTAIRLTEKRQRGKVGDLFRLSPTPGIFLWGRLVERKNFFGWDFPLNLIYIYDAISAERPDRTLLSPGNLILGPSVVNNLGFLRGYWQIMSSEPLLPADVLDSHVFIRFRGRGGREDYDLVDEQGAKLQMKHSERDYALAQSGVGNFNLIDWRIQEILETRGLMPKKKDLAEVDALRRPPYW